MTKRKSITKLKLSYTRTNIASSQEEVKKVRNDIYLDKILKEFILPFRKGDFNQIDPYFSFSKYLEALTYTKNENISHNLAVESMAAALNAKNIYINFKIQESKVYTKSRDIINLQQQIDELNKKLRSFDDAFLNSNLCIKIGATASVETFNMLPYLASQNIYLGWYYYFNKYDLSVGIDPDEYLRVKKFVETLGIEPLPGKIYSNALVTLLKQIKYDEAQLQATNIN